MARFALKMFAGLVTYAAVAMAVGWGALAFPFLGSPHALVLAEVLLALGIAAAWVAARRAAKKRDAAATATPKPPLAARIAAFFLIALLVALISFRIVREVIPAGVGPRAWVAYLQWSYGRSDLVSPDGLHRVVLRTNDPGALRSGNCWTWVIVRDPLRGKRVVAEGYAPEPSFRTPGPPLRYCWNPDGSLTLDFLSDHQSRETDLPPVTVKASELE